MNALEAEIRKIVAADGPIPVAQFIALALGHPTHGYYAGRDPFGARGDFITAPEISQMFGELIGLWAAAVWGEMGSPDRIRLVELGPGRGTLMADALRAAKIAKEFHAALAVDLVEISPAVRRRPRPPPGASGRGGADRRLRPRRRTRRDAAGGRRACVCPGAGAARRGRSFRPRRFRGAGARRDAMGGARARPGDAARVPHAARH